jgi:SAM-dependent methyltransferase
MKSEEGEFWDQRFRQEGALWGDVPSPTAVLLAPLLTPGARVLDVGFGYGRDLVYLAERGFRVSGIDLSVDGQVLARRRLADRALQAENLYRGRFEETDLPGGYFDAVLNHRMAHLLTSIESLAAFAAHIRGVMRPGGLLALAARSTLDYDPGEMVPVEPGVYEYRIRPGHRIRYWDEDTVRLFCSTGFERITTRAETEAECVTHPVPCRLLLLIARKIPAVGHDDRRQNHINAPPLQGARPS